MGFWEDETPRRSLRLKGPATLRNLEAQSRVELSGRQTGWTDAALPREQIMESQ